MLFGSPLILCKTFWMTKGDNDVILEFSSSDSIIMKRGKTWGRGWLSCSLSVSSASDDDNEALAFFLLFNPIIALQRTSSFALSTRHGAQQGNTLIEWSSNSQLTSA